MTKLRRDQLVVVDIEATCWRRSEPPPGQFPEIIEVGLCILDLASATPSRKRSILVKPERSRVSSFCRKLTGITQEMVDGGVSFAEACETVVKEYDTFDLTWVSWGDYDRRKFQAQCRERNVPYPFSDSHINVKRVYAEVKKIKPVGLGRAVRDSHLEFEGSHHRGHDDAWNIAKVLGILLKEHGPSLLAPYWQA
ncbi:MAG: exonuclease domain-containing protein [Chloroflexi bacterium]|nr:exonuclease domain-containing protein [Chloroflexota bacterium]